MQERWSKKKKNLEVSLDYTFPTQLSQYILKAGDVKKFHPHPHLTWEISEAYFLLNIFQMFLLSNNLFPPQNCIFGYGNFNPNLSILNNLSFSMQFHKDLYFKDEMEWHNIYL